MKNSKYILLAGAIMLLSAFTIHNSIDFKVADGHNIKFSGTDVEGIFKTLTGTVKYDQDNLSASTCSFEIEVNSINTGNGTKNKHAISKKWFDAEKHPKIKFQSIKFLSTGNANLVTGTMEIHGIKKQISIPYTYSNNTFKAQFSVNRLDFKVGTMDGMSKKVSNEIKLDVTIPVINI